MTKTQSATPPRPLSTHDASTYDADPGRGWLLFAAVLFTIIGALNVIYGIAAISDSKFYVQDVTFVFGNLNLWGWLLTIVGVAQLFTAFGISREAEWARWLGIALASGNMLVQFLVMPASPVWAVMIVFVDIIVIYGLLTYGGRDRRSLAG